MIFAHEIYSRSYEKLKSIQNEWFKNTAKEKIKSLINDGYDKFEVVKHFQIKYPYDSLGKLLLALDIEGFALSDDYVITVASPLNYHPEIFEQTYKDLIKEQEDWFDSTVENTINALIDAGYNPSEITQNFRIRFPKETLGKPLINFSQCGYDISDEYIITIREDFM